MSITYLSYPISYIFLSFLSTLTTGHCGVVAHHPSIWSNLEIIDTKAPSLSIFLDLVEAVQRFLVLGTSPSIAGQLTVSTSL